MMVYCVFSLESPHRGDSNENTQYTFSRYEKENHSKLSQICSYGIFSKGLKNEFETAVGKRAISARATEVLLWNAIVESLAKCNGFNALPMCRPPRFKGIQKAGGQVDQSHVSETDGIPLSLVLSLEKTAVVQGPAKERTSYPDSQILNGILISLKILNGQCDSYSVPLCYFLEGLRP